MIQMISWEETGRIHDFDWDLLWMPQCAKSYISQNSRQVCNCRTVAHLSVAGDCMEKSIQQPRKFWSSVWGWYLWMSYQLSFDQEMATFLPHGVSSTFVRLLHLHMFVVPCITNLLGMASFRKMHTDIILYFSNQWWYHLSPPVTAGTAVH